MKKFNINNYVYVKLTDIGYEQYLDKLKYYHDTTPTLFEWPTIENIKLKEDKNGYLKFQMWEVMDLFGENLFNGCDKPFELDILIDENDLKYRDIELL